MYVAIKMMEHTLRHFNLEAQLQISVVTYKDLHC